MGLNTGMGGAYGRQPNMARIAQKQSANQKRAGFSGMGAMAVVVWDYYPGTQRVDVVDKGNLSASPIRNIPIGGNGGAFKVIRPFIVANPRSDFNGPNPTVGIVVFPDADVGNTWVDNGRHPPTSFARRGIEGAVFVADALTTADGEVETGYDDQDIVLLAGESGSSIVFKANGDVLINAAGKLIADGTTLHLGGDGGDAAARVGDLTDIQDGDAGDGNHAHAIDEGSSKVFIS